MRNLQAAALVLLAFVTPPASAKRPPSPADAKLVNTATLIFAGRTDEARKPLREALDAYRAAGDRIGEGVSLYLLGLADVHAEERIAASGKLTAASSRLISANDGYAAWMVLVGSADLERTTGNFPLAVERYETALDFVRALAATEGAISFDGAALIATAFGGSAGDVELLADPSMKPVLLDMAEILTRAPYGGTLVDAGYLEEAGHQLAEASRLSATLMGAFDFAIEAHQGDLYRRLWCFNDARISYEKALNGFAGLPSVMALQDQWINVSIYGQLAEIELLSGNADAALRWNDKALAVVRPSNPKQEASVLERRGELLLRAGRFAAADVALGDALKLASGHGDVGREASLRSYRGLLNVHRGRYGEAVKELETAVGLYQKVGRLDAEALCWTALSSAYIGLGAGSSARVTVERARELAAASGFALTAAIVETLTAHLSGKGTAEEFGRWWELPESGLLMFDDDMRRLIRELAGLSADGAMPSPHRSSPLVTALSHLVRGKLLLERGELAAARQELTVALNENRSADLRATFLAGIGATYWKEGNVDAAIRFLTDAVNAVELPIEDARTEQLVAGYFGSYRHWYFEVLIEMLVRKGRIAEAFDQSERARARALQQTVGNTRLRPIGTQPALVAEAESLRTTIRLLAQTAAIGPAVAAVDLPRAKERYEGLLARLHATAPEYLSMTRVEPLVLEEVRASLPANTTLISFFLSGPRAHAWVLDAERLEHVTLPIEPARLRRIACWAELLGRSNDPEIGRGAKVAPRCGADLAVTAEEAYEALIAPLRPRIRNVNLILVPHGVLHTVPFAALRDRRTGRYLIEDYTLSYAPSAGALRFLQEKESEMTGRALVIGDPAGATSALLPLPAAEAEAEYVARLFGTNAIIGSAATENLLREARGRYDLIHIGTHASHDAASPLFSRIELARAPDDPESDGNLEVHEILSDLDLTGVDLVVLSACSSAAGTGNAGDDVMGLTQAMLYAGAPAVISTLWEIKDEAAEALMRVLYSELRAGTPAAEALRKAQLALLGNEYYRQPQRWAAFVLTGSPSGRWNGATGRDTASR